MKDITEIFLPYLRKFFFDKRKRKIFLSSRQIGKSFTIAGILSYKALSKKNGLSLCISTGARAASEIIRKCQLFAEAIKVMTDGQIDYSASFDQIKFSNGSRILSLPSSTDGANLRGFTASCVCIDEAAYISHLDTILQAINPTLTRNKDAELILTTTPAGRNGTFYEMYMNAIDDPEWYVQTTTIQDAIDDGLNVDIESLKTLCPDPDVFKQEYCCEFLSEYGTLIDTEIIDWYENISEATEGCYIGVDVGRTHDKTAITILKTKKDKMWIDDIIMLDKMRYEDLLNVIRDLNNKHHFTAGYVDQGGIGSALAEFVTSKVSSKIKGLSFTGSNKTPMFEALRAGIFEHKLSINTLFKKLIETDFRNVSRIITEAGEVKYTAGHDLNGHSDVTSSIVLAIKSMKDNPLNATLPTFYKNSSAFGSYRSRL